MGQCNYRGPYERETGGSESLNRDVMETEVGVIQGRHHEPGHAGGLQKRGKASRKTLPEPPEGTQP